MSTCFTLRYDSIDDPFYHFSNDDNRQIAVSETGMDEHLTRMSSSHRGPLGSENKEAYRQVRVIKTETNGSGSETASVINRRPG